MSHLLYSELLEKIKNRHYVVTIGNNGKKYWLNDEYMLGHMWQENNFHYRDTFHDGNIHLYHWWYDRIQFTMENNLQRLFNIPQEGYYKFPNSTYGITLPYVIKNFISSSPLPHVTRQYLELFGQYPNEKYYTPVQSSVIKSFNDLSSGYSASSHPYVKSFYQHYDLFEHLGKQHRYQYEDGYIYLYHEHKIPVLYSVSILNDARTSWKDRLISSADHKRYSLQMASIAIAFVEDYYNEVYAHNLQYGYTDCDEFYHVRKGVTP